MAPKMQSLSVVKLFGTTIFQLLVLIDYFYVIDAAGASLPVTLQVTDKEVVMDNGLIKLTLNNPNGSITAIQYQGAENVLETTLGLDERGYWDIDWNPPGQKRSASAKIIANSFSVIVQDKNQVEVSFKKTYEAPSPDIPMNFDKRFVMLPGRSGFYTYAIYDHPKGYPDVDVDQTRIAVKLSKSMFNYLAVSDNIQGEMPSYSDRMSGQNLTYKEAVLLTNPSNPKFKGLVDDKYIFSQESTDLNLHGWISNKPRMGFWLITGSNEFRTGGPIKQDLTAHCGPFVLSMFISLHYAGEEYSVLLRKGEPWKRVFGPVFVYLNTDTGNNPRTLWEDAKKQMATETKSWPYDFLKSEDYPTRKQRGSVTGRLLVHDRQANSAAWPAKSAYIGLAQPGEAGMWQRDLKNYQFWTQTDKDGNFMINAVWAGDYSLFAYVPGVFGDFKHKVDLKIKPGDNIKVGDVVFEPPRNGPTLWEIGIPDKKAAEFFIPDPLPTLTNYIVQKNHPEKYRQYGLWDRYTDLYPKEDLVYTVGKSDYKKDWFYAHVNRRVGKTYSPTTWTIKFPLDNVIGGGSYTLRIALASSTAATVQVGINGKPNVYIIKEQMHDNAIARHGIHGIYSEHNFEISGSQLVKGENTITLRQAKGGSPFFGVMYDYIRLEGPKS